MFHGNPLWETKGDLSQQTGPWTFGAGAKTQQRGFIKSVSGADGGRGNEEQRGVS